jgi:hypothetical protein
MKLYVIITIILIAITVYGRPATPRAAIERDKRIQKAFYEHKARMGDKEVLKQKQKDYEESV